jgi:hypothetical protein
MRLNGVLYGSIGMDVFECGVNDENESLESFLYELRDVLNSTALSVDCGNNSLGCDPRRSNFRAGYRITISS